MLRTSLEQVQSRVGVMVVPSNRVFNRGLDTRKGGQMKDNFRLYLFNVEIDSFGISQVKLSR
jgi:hypothetical protein